MRERGIDFYITFENNTNPKSWQAVPTSILSEVKFNNVFLEFEHGTARPANG